MRFKNRHEAGERLAHTLEPYITRPAIVYALPRGGVPVAVEVALAHGLPLDLVIARKIGHPMQPEYAVCAVGETGDPVCNPEERAHLDREWLEGRVAAERAEARRRRKLYCGGHTRRSAAGQCAILVDDGIATGLSMEAAVAEIRADRPSRLIVAVAVAPRETAQRFAALCDAFVAAHLPPYFEGAVGAYYDDFRQVPDEQVLSEMARLEQTGRRARHA